MKKFRPAVMADKEQFRELWDISFNDNAAFSDWFFNNRFIPEYNALIEEEDGKISSEVQSMPVFLNVRDFVIPSTIMVGACTHPDFKRRGYMKELYTYYMGMVRKMGIVLCAHTPAVLKTYFYVGHYPVSDTAFIKTDASMGAKVNANVEAISLKGNVSNIYRCYQMASQKYSGIILRSYADFKLKCADYMSCGAKCAFISKNNIVTAYAVYFDDENGIYGEEIMSVDDNDEQEIVNFLINEGKGRKVTIKLPPQSKSEYNNGIKTIGPRNVCGVANIQALLKAVGKGAPFSIEIKDDVVLENNGVFDFNGNITDKKPCLSAPVYAAAQWLFGYRSLKELSEEGLLNVNDMAALNELDRLFPKQNCHIVDEY